MADSPVRVLVKIGDPTTAGREAAVDASGNLATISAVNAGINIGDVDVVAFDASLTDADDDGIAFAAAGLRTINLLYGSNGADWERVTTDGSGALDVGLSAVGGLTALELIDDTVKLVGSDTYTEATDRGNLIVAVRNDALDTLASLDNEFAPLQVDANGSLYVTGGGGGQEYVEDIAAPTDPTGSATVMRRDDVLAAGRVDAEDDWVVQYCTDEGALWVQDFNSDAILADTAAIDTATAIVAAAVVQDDVATHSGASTGMILFAAATPTDPAVDSNDFGALAMSVDRRLHVDADITGLDGVDLMLGTDFSNVMGAATLILTNQADGLADTLDAMLASSLGYYYNGSDWDRVRGDLTDGMLVNLGANNDVTTTPFVGATPIAVHATEVDTAIDGTFDVDEADTAGAPSYCVGFDASSSVPIKAQLQSVDNDTPTIKVTLFAAAGEPIHWRPPHREYFLNDVTGGAGFDGWRVVITNKDGSDAADVYGTIYTERA